MRDTMTHRGPDDAGIYISPDGRVGLGHRRLSIVDLSPAGRQPMSNEDGTVWITFNGEIYNHAVLPGTVLFGSEIKAILTHQRVSRRIDLAAFYHYLTFIAAPAPRTLFQGIHKLPPATRVIVDRLGELRAEIY